MENQVPCGALIHDICRIGDLGLVKTTKTEPRKKSIAKNTMKKGQNGHKHENFPNIRKKLRPTVKSVQDQCLIKLTLYSL